MPVPHITPDKLTGAAVGIEVEHSMIHDGHSFTAHYESPGGALPTNPGEETAIGFITPSLPIRIHMTVDAWADDESILEIREDPVVVRDQGSVYDPLNRLRIGAHSAMLDHQAVPVANALFTYTVIEANAANLSGGVILHHETLAIGTAAPFASKMNTASRGSREFVLNPDTEYVVILTTGAANVNDTVHNIALNWYEHTDSNYIR